MSCTPSLTVKAGSQLRLVGMAHINEISAFDCVKGW